MPQSLIERARNVIQIEIQAIQEVSSQLGESFTEAASLISKCSGKVIFCGIGKSGHISQKLASTFSSISIPSVFLHPAEGIHGDLGLLDQNDIIIFISQSGETQELSLPLKYALRKRIPVIAITGNPESSLSQNATLTLTTTISKEACPFNLAPTASTTAALVLGDALGLVAAHLKGYSPETFAEIHPAGNLGLRLTIIQEMMTKPSEMALVTSADSIKTLIEKMTHSHVRGVAAVMNDAKLSGVVTDGDLRRYLEKSTDLNQTVSTIMSPNPKTVRGEDLVEKAISKMEEFKIQSVFVTDDTQTLLGMVHIQDVLKLKLR